MVAGLLKLVDASAGVAAEVLRPKKDEAARLLGTIVGGITDQRLVSVYRALVERGGYSFDLCHGGPAGRTNSTVVCTRQQMAENRPWRHRPDLDPWRALDCEYFACSNQYLPERGCVHLIVLTRSGREHPFGELERRIVAMFHSELGRLWRRTEDDVGAGLPPHLQRTLELLLEGACEGEIVNRLQLSRHTVHDHVKRLYRRFQVNSRGQLLARMSQSLLARAPRLCVQLLASEDDRRFDAVDAPRPRVGGQPAGPRPFISSIKAARA